MFDVTALSDQVGNRDSKPIHCHCTVHWSCWQMGRGAAALGVDREAERRQQERREGRRDERSAAERHCQPLACQLQACASRWVYKAHKCNELRATYNACISDFLEAAEKAKEQSMQKQTT